MEKWNYYFRSCQAVSIAGAVVELPEGLGIVTLGENLASEHVFFPVGQLEFHLVPGEVRRLKMGDLTERHGQLR